MPTNANLHKSEFLGMNFGTASHRLRKAILFSLVQETGRDICFRCGKKIEMIQQLSIEHKQPWLDVSTDLFWNLDNIAFSHLNCNCKVRRRLHAKYQARGEACGQSILTANQVRQIRAEYAKGDTTHRKLAAKYGVKKSGINSLLNYHNWKHIP